MRSCGRRVGSSLISVALVSALLSVLVPAVPVGATASSCPDVVVLGVRGSGQAGPVSLDWPVLERAGHYADSGVGPQVRAFADRLMAALGGDVRVVPVAYPAVSVPPWDFESSGVYSFNKSVKRGVQRIGATLAELEAACPNQLPLLVLVGYSQGAEVVHRALRHGVFDAVAANVAAVVVVADPWFDKSASDVNFR